MNRSVNLYFLDEGILSNVGGHLKRNWGKYALGAAALAGGAAITNPALATHAGTVVGNAAVNAGKFVGDKIPSIAKTATNVGDKIAGAAKTAGGVVEKGMRTYQKGILTGARKVMPNIYTDVKLKATGMTGATL